MTHTYPDGSTYVGHWNNGKRHGCGKNVYADGKIYDGEWVDCTRHGYGVQKWPSGEKCDGEEVGNMFLRMAVSMMASG
jgi:hypothetical protein